MSLRARLLRWLAPSLFDGKTRPVRFYGAERWYIVKGVVYAVGFVDHGEGGTFVRVEFTPALMAEVAAYFALYEATK